MRTAPSMFKVADLPVEQVSWEDCERFCERVRERCPGLVARLPTEAEWEYACRAGTVSAYDDGSPCAKPDGKDPALLKLGWFDENSERRTHAVRGLAPNQWGLYDMHGNVWEWCSDWFGDYAGEAQVDPAGVDTGRGRVIRGGSWGDPAWFCRSAYRSGRQTAVRYGGLGFRLASGQ